MVFKFRKKEFEKMYNSKIDLIIKLKVNKKISSLRGGLSLELAEMKTKAMKTLPFQIVIKYMNSMQILTLLSK